MRHAILSCGLVLGMVSVASAQTPPTISLSSGSVVPGTTVSVTVQGVAGAFFAVIGSTTNQGFSFGGVTLGVGTDVTVHGTGVLDGSGRGTAVLTPPFPARDRYFLQAVTSLNAAFTPLQASASATLVNSDFAKPFVSIGGIVNANGTTQQLSPDVTVTRTGTGTYRIDYQSHFSTYVVPSFVPIGNRYIVTMTYDSRSAVVQFDTDTLFVFTIVPVRR